jgi:hypothetical protein
MKTIARNKIIFQKTITLIDSRTRIAKIESVIFYNSKECGYSLLSGKKL